MTQYTHAICWSICWSCPSSPFALVFSPIARFLLLMPAHYGFCMCLCFESVRCGYDHIFTGVQQGS